MNRKAMPITFIIVRNVSKRNPSGKPYPIFLVCKTKKGHTANAIHKTIKQDAKEIPATAKCFQRITTTI